MSWPKIDSFLPIGSFGATINLAEVGASYDGSHSPSWSIETSKGREDVDGWLRFVQAAAKKALAAAACWQSGFDY